MWCAWWGCVSFFHVTLSIFLVFVVLWQDPKSPEIRETHLCGSRGHHFSLIEKLDAESLVDQSSYFECPPGVLADVSGVLTTISGSLSVLWCPYIEPEIKVQKVLHRQERKQEEKLVLKPQGTFVRQCGYEIVAAGQLKRPCGVAVARNEIMIVADTENHRIQVLSLDGVFVRQWGSKGSGKGQFESPCGVVVSRDEVFVADSYNNRIQVFGLDGEFVRQWGALGSGAGKLYIHWWDGGQRGRGVCG